MPQPAVLFDTDIFSELPPRCVGSPPHGALGEATLPLITLSQIPGPPLVIYATILN